MKERIKELEKEVLHHKKMSLCWEIMYVEAIAKESKNDVSQKKHFEEHKERALKMLRKLQT